MIGIHYANRGKYLFDTRGFRSFSALVFHSKDGVYRKSGQSPGFVQSIRDAAGIGKKSLNAGAARSGFNPQDYVRYGCKKPFDA
jgi:hypothetical protein